MLRDDRGDPVDLTELLDRGYRYALALTHDESAAEDLIQDAWVSILKAGNPRSAGVLFRAIRSRFIDSYRRSRLLDLSSLDREPATPSGLLASLIAGDLLEPALAKLRSEERELLFLSAVEGYSTREISALTERSEGAIRVGLSRIRRKLRKLMSPEVSRCRTA